MLWFVLFVCCFWSLFDFISVLLGVQMGLLCSVGWGFCAVSRRCD